MQEFPFIGSKNFFPDGLFVDMSIAVYGSSTVYFNTLSIDSRIIYGSFLSDLGERFTFEEEISNSPNKSTDILSSSGRTVGKLVFGRDSIKSIRSIGTKVFSFSESVSVSPGCLFTVHKKMVSSIEVNSKKYRGIVNIVCGDGLNISGTGNEIIINATGKPISDNCCNEYDTIKSINSIHPSDGNIIIRPKDTGQPSNFSDPRQLIRVLPITQGISISLAN